MLEAAAAIAIALLVAREFLALGSGERQRLGMRIAGWSAVPFLLAFTVLFTSKVLEYLSGA